jgi:Iron-containing redox enzyme
MSFEQLEKSFEQTQRELVTATRDFNWADKNCYAHWLICTLNYVENSTRLLALAGGSMPPDKTAISNRFISHASEEKGHDKLLHNDLKGLGLNATSIKPTTEMLCYSRSLYYWVSPVGNPIGVIGWVLSLEGLAASVGPEIFEIVSSKFGVKSASFLKVHAESDPDHLHKALAVAKGLNEDELQIVMDALVMYSEQYRKILHSIEKKAAETINSH